MNAASRAARDLGRPYPLAAREGAPILGRLLPILAPYRRLLAAAVLLGVGHQVAVLAATGYSARLVGLAAIGAGADLATGLFRLGLLALLAGFLAWVRLSWEYELAHRILAELRIWLFRAFERLAPAGLAGRRGGELVATAMADIARVDWFFARFLPSVATALVVPAIALVFLAAYALSLAVALSPFLLLVGAAPFLFGGVARRQGEELRAAHAEIHAETLDGIEGLREILAFGQSEAWLDRLDRLGARLRGAQLRYGLRQGCELALSGGATSAGLFTVFWLAARRVAAGELAAENLPVVVLLAGVFFAPILAATGAAARLGLVRASAQRVFELLEQRPRVVEEGFPEAVGAAASGADPDRGDEPLLAFEEVQFRYGDDRPEVLRGISFAVRRGERVALAGASGAGKSTCIHLLLRFWDPVAGRIRFGGRDSRRMPAAELRQRIALVPQDGYLFDESVAANLRLGRPEADDAEVEAAARAAQAHDFILALPEDYSTKLGERGCQLSGGQRQRLLIARALLKRAELLVMDEAVSSLDAENEKAFAAALAGLGRERTVLLVAHRLSTLRWADRIVVIEDGRVAQEGTHDELLAAGGAYTRWIARAGAGGGPEEVPA